MSEKEHLSNLIWIIAIVVLLTFLIVVISWMSSGKLKVEKRKEQAQTAEINVESKTFIPESKKPESQIPALREEPAFTISKEPVKKESQEQEKSRAKELSTSSSVFPQTGIKTKAKESKEKLKNLEKEKRNEVKKQHFALQVGAFSSLENAKSLAKKLSAKGYKTSVKKKGNLIAVLIVDIHSRQEAQKLKEKLAKDKIDSSIILNP